MDKTGKLLVASAGVNNDASWSADCPSDLNDSNTTIAANKALGKDWTKRALGEHASIASFAAFTLALMSNQAPPNLISDSLTAAADEYRHAQTSFEIASLLLGDTVEPKAIPPSSHEFGYDRVSLALSTAEEGCIGETLSALEAAREVDAKIDAYEGINDETKALLKDKVQTIVLEESRHAMLAWRTVAWVCQEDKDACKEVLDNKLTPAKMNSALGRFFGAAGEENKARIEGEKIFNILVPYVENQEEAKVDCDGIDTDMGFDGKTGLLDQLANMIVNGVVCA